MTIHDIRFLFFSFGVVRCRNVAVRRCNEIEPTIEPTNEPTNEAQSVVVVAGSPPKDHL